MTTLGVTYGFMDGDLEQARREIQTLLRFEFEGRESSYWGEYYAGKTEQGETLKLIPNFNEAERELNEPDFPAVPMLLHVTGISDRERLTELRTLLGADNRFRLLREVEY